MTGRLGLMGAMPEEVEALVADFDAGCARHGHGGRVYHAGRLFGVDAVAVCSRMGKVAAATTATELIVRFGVDRIVFGGVAGALDASLSIGDIVVADRLWQHDMDASPIFPALEVPLLGVSSFATDAVLTGGLAESAGAFLRERAGAVGAGLVAGRVVRAGIASGDEFVSSEAARRRVRSRVPGAACVEMEGGAVAQVAFERGVPLGVFRMISDGAGEGADGEFAASLGRMAGAYTHGVVRGLLARVPPPAGRL